MKKILIFKIGALGDILMSTPFIRELRKKEKHAKIDFLVGENCKIILEKNTYIDSIISFDQTIFTKKKLLLFFKLLRKIRKEKYDEIYILDKHWIFSFFAYLTRIEDRIGFVREKLSRLFLTHFVKYTNDLHEVDFYLKLIHSTTSNKTLDYGKISSFDKNKVEVYLSKNNISSFVIFANLGGNDLEQSTIRKIPSDIFTKLLLHISKNKIVFLIGGEGDKKYYNDFILNKNIITIAGMFPISQTISLIDRAEHFYSTDCGPMHFGGCTSTPMTCFFGPTHPKRKIPFKKNCKAIWRDEKIYDSKYELDGTLPDKNKKYFQNLSINDLN